MTSSELIKSGVCRDLCEVFDMFPLEKLDDYGPGAGCRAFPRRPIDIGLVAKCKRPRAT